MGIHGAVESRWGYSPLSARCGLVPTVTHLKAVFPPLSNNLVLITEGFGTLPHVAPSALRFWYSMGSFHFKYLKI